MTQEQRNRLEYEAWKDTEQYADQMKERGAIDSYKQGFINGAEWMEQNQWVPVTERLPEKSGKYETTLNDGIVDDVIFSKASKEWIIWGKNVIAWRERPAPYSPKPEAK